MMAEQEMIVVDQKVSRGERTRDYWSEIGEVGS